MALKGSNQEKKLTDERVGPFFLLRWLRQVWDMDWGEVPGTTPLYGVLSASAGLFSALLVGAVVVMKDEEFFQSVLEFVHASVAATLGVSGVVAVLLIITLMVATIAGIALIGRYHYFSQFII